MIIAIDGPAASGKGTLGRRLAKHFGLQHLDTGLLYRAVASAMIEQGVSLLSDVKAGEIARTIDVSQLDEKALKRAEMSEKASMVSAYPVVREALLDVQRRFAAHPDGAVLDGRDIGTVICPHADVKLFVTASPEVRAQRRLAEVQARGRGDAYETILANIKLRDERDSARTVAPLKPADDAVLIDTSTLSTDAVFERALEVVENKK